ncbi:MAG: hypothetical protein JWM93_287 [Frankiales bacterium]|nr:hypothetical protein [Frankiales bacterium]
MPTVADELLIGCYSPPAGQGRGISTVALRGNAVGATASRPGPVESPSFLAVHPTLPLIYTVAEHAGLLVTLRRGPDGELTVVDERTTQGTEPCHVAVSPDGRWVAVANYGDGTLTAVPIDEGLPRDDGQLLVHAGGGPVRDRQGGPHCHQATFDGELLTVSDLGADRIHRYVLAEGVWVPATGGAAEMRPGSGPRHQVVDGVHRYVAGELDGTVTSYVVDDATGTWTEVGSARTTAFAGTSYPSHVVLRDGHLYVGNRGADTIGVLRIEDGRPVYVGETPTGGAWPRHFAIVGDRIVVANERSHELTVLPFEAGAVVPGAVADRHATGSPTCVVALNR